MHRQLRRCPLVVYAVELGSSWAGDKAVLNEEPEAIGRTPAGNGAAAVDVAQQQNGFSHDEHAPAGPPAEEKPLAMSDKVRDIQSDPSCNASARARACCGRSSCTARDLYLYHVLCSQAPLPRSRV